MSNPFEDLRQAVVIRPMNSPGPQGSPGPEIKVQYSPDGTFWHDDPVEIDQYMRFSVDNGVTWLEPVHYTNLPEVLEYVEKAKQWAENPENDEVEDGKYSALHHALRAARSETNAEAAALDAAGSAAEAFGAAAPAWDSETIYSYNDVVSFDNGHTYRCIGENIIGADHAPNINGVDNEEDWTRITVSPDGYFEIDEDGDLMPMITPITSEIFMLDENGDIMYQPELLPPYAKIQYSADGITWYDNPIDNGIYIRFSIDNGMSWGEPIRYVNLNEALKWVYKARQWAENPENEEVESGQYSALHHALKSESWVEKAKQWAENPENEEVEPEQYSALHHATKAIRSELSAEAAALDAAGSAAEAFGAAAPAWDSITVYNYNDVVSFDNGHTYRCIGTNIVGEDHAPNINNADNTEDWTRITVALNGYFELDENEDFMPMIAPITSDVFMLDENGDITYSFYSDIESIEVFAQDEAMLRSIIADAGSNPVSIIIYTDIHITSGDLFIPSNVNLHFKNNGKLSPADGVTLTINGSITAGLWQIFGSSNNLSISIANGTIPLAWFGNDLHHAVNSIGYNSATIRISSPIIISSNITIPNNIELYFTRNGKLIANTGITVTLNCGIHAGAWKIFDGEGTFNGSPGVDAVYPEWWGAVGDGVTDDTKALQAAADFCFGSALILKTLKKTYRITSTLQIRCHADMSLSRVNSDASFSPSIKVGDDNSCTFQIYFKGPYLLNTTKQDMYTGWGISQVPYPGAIGIQAINLNECDFTNKHIQNFCVGLQVTANSNKGNAYNVYRLGMLVNNKINLQVMPLDENSWCNENYFEGGRLHYYENSEQFKPGTRQIELSRGNSIWRPNGNTFVKPSLESSFCEYKLYLDGSYNTFIGCRWEGSAINVAFYGPSGSGSAASDNIFIGGDSLANLISNFVNLGDGNTSTTILGGTGLLSNPDTNKNKTIQFYNDSFSPYVDNVLNLGYPDRRWDTVYAATGTIQTSDEKEKTQLIPMEEAEKNVALKIKSMMGKFKFLDAIDKKGENNARIHFGTTAQNIAKAFESEGLDPRKYGMFCYDEWEADPENGIEAGSRYGIRYNELLAFLIAAL